MSAHSQIPASGVWLPTFALQPYAAEDMDCYRVSPLVNTA